MAASGKTSHAACDFWHQLVVNIHETPDASGRLGYNKNNQASSYVMVRYDMLVWEV